MVGNSFYRASSNGLTKIAIEIIRKAHEDTTSKYPAIQKLFAPTTGWAYNKQTIEEVVNSKHNCHITEDFREKCLDKNGHFKSVESLIN